MLCVVLLVVGLAAGFAAGYQFVNKSVKNALEKRIAAIQLDIANKLVAVHAEIDAVEQTADRRLVPAIHKVTARIREAL